MAPRLAWGLMLLPLSCGDAGGGSTATGAGGRGGGGGAAGACSPGEERVCLCYGVANGSQVCGADGEWQWPCPACNTGGQAGAAGSGGGGSGSGGSGGGASGSGGAAGAAGAGGSGGIYTEADCIKAARNGSEVCDDAAWKVEAPGTDLVLVCLTDAGGVIYVSTNTGPPDPNDGIKRCQGWEIGGQNAWDHLAYMHQLICTQEQQLIDLDLSAWVGSTLYFGAHNLPSGGGQFTHMCLAHKK